MCRCSMPDCVMPRRRFDFHHRRARRVEILRIERIGKRHIDRDLVARDRGDRPLGVVVAPAIQPGLCFAVAHHVVHVHEFDPRRGDRPADGNRIADGEFGSIADVERFCAGRNVGIANVRLGLGGFRSIPPAPPAPRMAIAICGWPESLIVVRCGSSALLPLPRSTMPLSRIVIVLAQLNVPGASSTVPRKPSINGNLATSSIAA